MNFEDRLRPWRLLVIEFDLSDDLLLDHSFGAVLLAVIAIAARSSEDPRVLLHDTRLTAGWQWFRQIRLLRPNLLETTCVHELQLYCVRSLIHGVFLLIVE